MANKKYFIALNYKNGQSREPSELQKMLIDPFTLNLLPILFTAGIAAGTVDAVAGGGGLISLPILLGVGVPPHIALGTNKLQSMFGTGMASYSYYRHGWLEPKKLIPGLIYSFIGSTFGAIVTQLMSAVILKKLIPLLLAIVLIYTVFSPRLGLQERSPRLDEKWFYLIFGLLLGFYDGFLGPGAGAFWTFVLMFFLGFQLTKATAYTKAFNLNTNVAALLCFIVSNNINYSIALCMAAGQLIGGKVGARLAIKNGVKIIRPIFITVVFTTIITLVYKNHPSAPVLAQLTPVHLAKQP